MDGSRKIFLVLAAALLLLGACGDESGGGTADEDETAAAEAGDECETDSEVTLDSGLRYTDIECGDGEEASRGDSVEVHYVGTLENGKKFDSSRDRGQTLPVQLGAGQVIPGFEEGILGMKVGGIREVTIPPDLGYGEAGAPPAIPPNATLIFEIELVSIS